MAQTRPAEEVTTDQAGPDPATDLDSPQLYLNRELTWLAFNRRVLQRRRTPRTPLLERVKFLAITASNLDEFFMKRIGGLKQQVGAGMQRADASTAARRSSRSPSATRVIARARARSSAQLLAELLRAARASRTSCIAPYDELDAGGAAARCASYYCTNIFPLVTPQAMDPAHPFPFISNLSLNLLVTLRYPKRHRAVCWRASRCRSAPASRASCASATAHASCRSRT